MIGTNQSQHYDPYNELMCYHFKQSEHSFPVSIIFMISSHFNISTSKQCTKKLNCSFQKSGNEISILSKHHVFTSIPNGLTTRLHLLRSVVKFFGNRLSLFSSNCLFAFGSLPTKSFIVETTRWSPMMNFQIINKVFV